MSKTGPSSSSAVCFRPFVKETARHIQLASDFIHPPAVHRSWRVAEMLRMHRHSSSIDVSRAWRRAKFERYQAFMWDQSVVQACICWDQCVPFEVARKGLVFRRVSEPSIVVHFAI